jgi:hypothetical protein
MLDFYYDEESNRTAAATNRTRFLNHQSSVEHYTEHEEIVIIWTARVAGVISFIGGLYILCMAYKRRDHVYHRLMLGT